MTRASAAVVEGKELPIAFDDLPEEVLRKIIWSLPPASVASLCTMNNGLKQLAGDQALWKKLTTHRWPKCPEDLVQEHSGNWQALFRARQSQPHMFTVNLDQIHGQRLTEEEAVRQQGDVRASKSDGGADTRRRQPQGPDFCIAAKSLFALGLCLANEPRLKATAEFGVLRRDLEWWMEEHTQQVVAFVRQSVQLATEFDFWMGGFQQWPEIPWRRSALQFLVDLDLQMHESVRTRLAGLLKELDKCMVCVNMESEHMPAFVPSKVPTSHWWYFLRGGTGSPRVC